jgi:hypothetical protein
MVHIRPSTNDARQNIHAGVLPMSLKNQAVAQRLAVCNDIGEAAYVASLVAAGMVDSMLQTPTGPAIAEAFTQRCGSADVCRV